MRVNKVCRKSDSKNLFRVRYDGSEIAGMCVLFHAGLCLENVAGMNLPVTLIT